MEKGARTPAGVYKMLLVLATVIWGASFVFMKDAVAVMEPAWLIGVRFTITSVLLTAVFWRQVRKALTRHDIVLGALLGLANFLAYWVQTIGLAYTTPGKNAFLSATYVVIVPFIYWLVAARRPTVANLAAAALCVAGSALVSLGAQEAGVGLGDLMSLLSAVFFAVHIVLVGRFAPGRNVLALTVYQFWTGGVCGLLVGSASEPLPDPAAMLAPGFLLNMAYLIVFASCIALVIQNVALAKVPPAQASLLLSLESVFGVVFSVLLYGEHLTGRLLLGFGLIFSALLVSELFPRKRQRALHEGAPPDQAGEGERAAPVGDLLSEDPMGVGELPEGK